MPTKESINTFSDIIELLLTHTEAAHFIEQINTLGEVIFNKDTDVEKKVDELFSTRQKILLLKVFKKEDIDLQDHIALQKFLNLMKKTIEETPTVSLTLAYNPKYDTLSRIYVWLRFHFKLPVLINIYLNKAIIAGAIIEFKGKHFEYTIHKVLYETLKKE